jgi:UDPglucose 6-dehydrogenase
MKSNKKLSKSKSKIKIGIIGVGMVGGALKRYFESIGLKPLVFDKYKKMGSLADVNKAEVVFICVATPYGERGFDLSMVEDAFGALRGEKVVVLRSTVWPGTTEKMQKKYPQHKILFNPEFLSEATADKNLRHPDIQLIGYTAKSKPLARTALEFLPRAPYENILPAKDAEMFKYFHNVHGAVKVIFANQMYDLCEKIGANYDNMVECAASSKNIGTAQYLSVWHKNFRGYGGSCFPKDMKALIQFGNKEGIDLRLLKTAEKVNYRLSKIKRLEKDLEKKSW